MSKKRLGVLFCMLFLLISQFYILLCAEDDIEKGKTIENHKNWCGFQFGVSIGGVVFGKSIIESYSIENDVLTVLKKRSFQSQFMAEVHYLFPIPRLSEEYKTKINNLGGNRNNIDM